MAASVLFWFVGGVECAVWNGWLDGRRRGNYNGTPCRYGPRAVCCARARWSPVRLVRTMVLRCHGPRARMFPRAMAFRRAEGPPPFAYIRTPPLFHITSIAQSIYQALLTPYSVLSHAMTTATSRHLWRYTTLPPVFPCAAGRTSSQYNKLLSLPGDITNFSPREFWSPIVMMTTRGYGAGERVVAIMGDLSRDKVSARSLAW